MHRIDLTGKSFGRLTALAIAIPDKFGHSRWLCHCACGNEAIVTTERLRSAHTRSCGCLIKERIGALNRTHGHASGYKLTPEYRVWCSMKARCCNRKNRNYKNYGGRGIKVCERWLSSFQAFFDDMGTRPAGTSIDRYPNNNGDYEPGNCRWANAKQQNSNTRKNIMVGSVTLKEFARLNGVPYMRVYKRVVQRGMKPQEALQAGVRIGELRFKGRLLKEISRQRAINYYTLRMAYRRGENPLTFRPRFQINRSG